MGPPLLSLDHARPVLVLRSFDVARDILCVALSHFGRRLLDFDSDDSGRLELRVAGQAAVVPAAVADVAPNFIGDCFQAFDLFFAGAVFGVSKDGDRAKLNRRQLW
jgi:hypothetical protein